MIGQCNVDGCDHIFVVDDDDPIVEHVIREHAFAGMIEPGVLGIGFEFDLTEEQVELVHEKIVDDMVDRR